MSNGAKFSDGSEYPNTFEVSANGDHVNLYTESNGDYGHYRYTPPSKEQLGQIIEALQQAYADWKI